MKKEWAEIALGELTAHRPICYGVLKPGERQTSGVPLIRITDITNNDLDESDIYHITPALSAEFRRSVLQGGEVLLSIQGTIGRVAICPEHLKGANISRTIALISPDDRIDRSFLRYWLLSLDGDFPICGSTRASLNIGALRELKAPIPSLADQKRIVRMLDEAFAELATAQANAEKNLQNARALFESHLQSVFTHRGEGWSENTMDELIESSLIGLTRSSKEQSNDKRYPYVKMNHITRDNRFEFNDYVTVDATKEEADRFALQDGDFLFNTRNSHELVGKSCIYSSAVQGTVLFNNNIMRIRFRAGIDARFVLYAFSSKIVADELEGLKSGTTNVSAIYFKDLRNLRVPLPPTAEQTRIADELDSLSVETQHLARIYEQKQAALAELKKSLLQQAFSCHL